MSLNISDIHVNNVDNIDHVDHVDHEFNLDDLLSLLKLKISNPSIQIVDTNETIKIFKNILKFKEEPVMCMNIPNKYSYVLHTFDNKDNMFTHKLTNYTKTTKNDIINYFTMILETDKYIPIINDMFSEYYYHQYGYVKQLVSINKYCDYCGCYDRGLSTGTCILCNKNMCLSCFKTKNCQISDENITYYFLDDAQTQHMFENIEHCDVNISINCNCCLKNINVPNVDVYSSKIIDIDVCAECANTCNGEIIIKECNMVENKTLFLKFGNFGSFVDWVPIYINPNNEYILLCMNHDNDNFNELALCYKNPNNDYECIILNFDEDYHDILNKIDNDYKQNKLPRYYHNISYTKFCEEYTRNISSCLNSDKKKSSLILLHNRVSIYK